MRLPPLVCVTPLVKTKLLTGSECSLGREASQGNCLEFQRQDWSMENRRLGGSVVEGTLGSLPH